jgi:hypothetical protein
MLVIADGPSANESARSSRQRAAESGRALVGRGARHHIFSAVSMNTADEILRIVAADPSTLTTC